MADSGSASDFQTDLQTIRDYVSAVSEANQKIATGYLAALDNVQVAFQAASPSEAKPDLMGVIAKAGLKLIEKQAATAIEKVTGVNLGPVFELVHSISEAVDKAHAAQQNLAAADWIAQTRAAISNAFTQAPSGDALRKQIEDEYNANNEGGRGGYIAGIELELEAVRVLEIPTEEQLELQIYQSWINGNFNGDCMDGVGLAFFELDSDGQLTSATLVAPLGAKIAHAINNLIDRSGKISSLMELDIVKKLSFDGDCACFEGNNVVRKPASNDDTQAWLSSSDTWQLIRRFSDA